MFLRPKDSRTSIVALVATHPFENREPVMQAVGQDMDVRLIVGDHRTVDPDFVTAQTVGGQDLTSLSKTSATEVAPEAIRSETSRARAD
jgi:hypothetical protein